MGFEGISIGPIHAPNPLHAFAPASDSDDGFGTPFDAYLPQPLQVVENTLEGAARRIIDLARHDERPTPDGSTITDPLARSIEAQRALIDHHGQYGNPDRFHASDSWKVWRTEVWPQGQVLHGRIMQAMSDGSWDRVQGMFKDLEAYRDGDGYSGGIGFTRQRYYDDNEWIGLASLQAYGATKDERYLKLAEHTFTFVAEGESPQGGMFWYEQDKAGRHTCSTAPAGEFAMRLFEATGGTNTTLLDFATRQAEWLADNLRGPSGLYGDNINNAGKVDPTIYSYNQGTALGLDVLLYRTTGDRRYLDRAKQTAHAAMDLFQGERLWKEAPVFNAVFMRNLLALHAVDPDPTYVTYIDGYLDRLWTEARDPDTGLFSKGGVGTYQGHGESVIDQGGVAQLFAARALPPDKWNELT
jgi:rhamnogalacturonyl hydrolase YesR